MSGGKLVRLAWGIQFALAFVLPWALVIGSANVLEHALPGVVKVDHWRHFCSIAFLSGGLWAAVLLRQRPIHRIARIAFSMLVLAGSLWFAVAIQMRSNCGDEPVYIGGRPPEQDGCR